MTPIFELEQQLVQLSPDDRLYLIEVLAKSLNGVCKQTTQPVADSLSNFFQRSPLAEIVTEEELDLTRDRSLPIDRFVL